jgi:hypothetical protein
MEEKYALRVSQFLQMLRITCALASQRVSTYFLKGWQVSSWLSASMMSWSWRKSFRRTADLEK